MGSPLSPVVAGLFVEDFEQMALVTADREPKQWLRYVDETFIIWPHGRTQLAAFLDHLNNLCEKIQFTMEIEEENQLPFLDVLVKRNEYTLTTSVFRKKTHTDRYLHFWSHHHPQVKTSMVSCLNSRTERVCTRDDLKEELNHLSGVFQANGYLHAVTAGVLSKSFVPPLQLKKALLGPKCFANWSYLPRVFRSKTNKLPIYIVILIRSHLPTYTYSMCNPFLSCLACLLHAEQLQLQYLRQWIWFVQD